MKNLKKKRSAEHKNFQKGQSIVEMLIVSLALISLIKGILIFFWISLSLLWMEHQLYQGLICSAQKKSLKLCEDRVKQQIQRLNPLGKIKSLKIKNFTENWKGEIQWHFYKKDFFIKQSLNLPY